MRSDIIRTIRTRDEQVKIRRSPREQQFEVIYTNKYGANWSGHISAMWLNAFFSQDDISSLEIIQALHTRLQDQSYIPSSMSDETPLEETTIAHNDEQVQIIASNRKDHSTVVYQNAGNRTWAMNVRTVWLDKLINSKGYHPDVIHALLEEHQNRIRSEEGPRSAEGPFSIYNKRKDEEVQVVPSSDLSKIFILYRKGDSKVLVKRASRPWVKAVVDTLENHSLRIIRALAHECEREQKVENGELDDYFNHHFALYRNESARGEADIADIKRRIEQGEPVKKILEEEFVMWSLSQLSQYGRPTNEGEPLTFYGNYHAKDDHLIWNK